MESSLRAKQQQQQQQQKTHLLYATNNYCYLQFVHASTVKLFESGGTMVR